MNVDNAGSRRTFDRKATYRTSGHTEADTTGKACRLGTGIRWFAAPRAENRYACPTKVRPSQ
jgi:hypothetical protein